MIKFNFNGFKISIPNVKEVKYTILQKEFKRNVI